jgi:predicted RNase H-like nuclease
VFDKETEILMDERLPHPPDPLPVGPDPQGNCLAVGGRPMCVQKMTGRRRSQERFGDLFGKMQKGKVPASSVPSPHLCD